MTDNALDFNKTITPVDSDKVVVARVDGSGGYLPIIDLKNYAGTVIVVNDLESESISSALSAYQGKILKGLIDAINEFLQSKFTLTDRTTGVVYEQALYVDNGVIGFDLTEKTEE